MGVPAGRQDLIRNKLEGIPHVMVEFAEPDRAAIPPAAAPAVAQPAEGGVVPSGLQSSVEQKLGGHAEFEQFSAQLLDRNEALMSRAYALHSLAQRFPVEVDETLTASDRKNLHRIALEHLTALAREITANDRALRSILSAEPSAPAAVARSPYWQAAAEELFRTAQRSEQLLSALLGATPPDRPLEQVPADLLGAMAELRARIEATQASLR
jgi:hypothetical protein